METEWREVVGNSDYEVSRDGRVRRATEGRNTAPGRIVKPRTDPSGYSRVTLCGPNLSRKLWGIHRLVASAFVERSDGFDCVHHINHVKSDNRAENLEWCTQGMNTRYARAAGYTPTFDRAGAANGNSKLSEDDVRAIRGWHATGYGPSRIAAMFGISKSHACYILRKQSWAHVD